MPSILLMLEWLEGLAWTTAIRESAWGYPIIETAHVASIVVFAGLIIMMDLRLVGVEFTKAPLLDFQRRLFPWQMAGFIPSMATGILVFCVDPLRYYGNVLFRVKLVMLVLAGVNALAFHLKVYQVSGPPEGDTHITARARLAGVVSLVLWSATMVSGRLVAYNWFG